MKFLGISDEERLALEQNGVPVDTIKKLAAEQAALAQAENEKALREIQEVIGPHGSVTRLQAGGVKIERGVGIGVFEDGILKTMIDPQGNLFVGSDIEDPSETSLCVFVNEQIYNNEDMGEGDLLIGDNSEGVSNVKWDASEGRLQFRYGLTVQVYMDTDGSIKAGAGTVSIDADGVWIQNQQGAFGFEDTNGDRFNLYFYSDNDDNLGIFNDLPSKGIIQKIRTTSNDTMNFVFTEDTVAERVFFKIPAGSAGVKVWIGDNADGGIILRAGYDGSETAFNENSYDINFRVEGAADENLLFLDAGTDRVGIGNNTPSEKLDVNGNIRTADSLVIDEQASAPSNPATGDWKLYAKSDGLHILDDAGNSTGPLGTGGGGGSDGWNAASDTWTRTGDHTFTVSGDVTATYRKGTKVRYKDGGAYEYGVIISSSHAAGTTTVNLLVNTDYTMAAATITDKYLSYIDNPEGFPSEFNWTTSWTNLTVGSGAVVTQKVKFTSACLVVAHIEVVLGTGLSVGNVGLTLPVAMSGYGNSHSRIVIGFVNAHDDSGNTGYPCIIMTTSTTDAVLRRQDTSAGDEIRQAVWSSTQPFTWAASDVIYIGMEYFG